MENQILSCSESKSQAELAAVRILLCFCQPFKLPPLAVKGALLHGLQLEREPGAQLLRSMDKHTYQRLARVTALVISQLHSHCPQLLSQFSISRTILCHAKVIISKLLCTVTKLMSSFDMPHLTMSYGHVNLCTTAPCFTVSTLLSRNPYAHSLQPDFRGAATEL